MKSRFASGSCHGFWKFVFYMTSVPGRSLRRSRMSVAHPGAASTLAERMATDSGGEEWDEPFVGELRVSVLGLPVCGMAVKDV